MPIKTIKELLGIKAPIRVNNLNRLYSEIKKRKKASLNLRLNIDCPFSCDGQVGEYAPETEITAKTASKREIVYPMKHEEVIHGIRSGIVLTHLATAFHLADHELAEFNSIIYDKKDRLIRDVSGNTSEEYKGLVELVEKRNPRPFPII